MAELSFDYEPGSENEALISRFASGHGATVDLAGGHGIATSPDLIGSESLRAKWELSPIITNMEIIQ
jgi:hypothetical protein